MNGSVGNSVLAGCWAKATLQLSTGSAAWDTGPTEPGGQLWEGGTDSPSQPPGCAD